MTQEQIMSKSDMRVRCWHTRQFHLSDKAGHHYCEKCKWYAFVGQTTEVFVC